MIVVVIFRFVSFQWSRNNRWFISALSAFASTVTT